MKSISYFMVVLYLGFTLVLQAFSADESQWYYSSVDGSLSNIKFNLHDNSTLFEYGEYLLLYTSNNRITHVTCTNYYSGSTLIFNYSYNKYRAETSLVATDETDGLWNCNIDHEESSTTFVFNIIVQYSLMIITETTVFNSTPSSHNMIYEFQPYHFTKISCLRSTLGKKTQLRFGYIYWKFCNVNRICQETQTVYENESVFEITFQNEDVYKYLTCIYTSHTGINSIVTVNLKLKNNADSHVKCRISGYLNELGPNDVISILEQQIIKFTFEAGHYINKCECLNTNTSFNMTLQATDQTKKIFRSSLTATDDADGNWLCSFFRSRGVNAPVSTYHDGHFYVVDKSRFSVKVQYLLNVTVTNINTKELSHLSTKLMQYEYVYRNGSNLQFECKREKVQSQSLPPSSTLHWKYCRYGKITKCYNVTYPNGRNLHIYKKMLTKENNNDILSCIYTTALNMRTELKIIFRLEMNRAPTIKINNTALTLLSNLTNTYLYEYNLEDLINVNCVKDSEGTLHWDYCALGSAPTGQISCDTERNKNNDIYRYLRLTELDNESTLRCIYTNTHNEVYTTNVEFKLKPIVSSNSGETKRLKVNDNARESAVLDVFPTEFEYGGALQFNCTKPIRSEAKIFLEIPEQRKEEVDAINTIKHNSTFNIVTGKYNMFFSNERVKVSCEVYSENGKDLLDRATKYVIHKEQKPTSVEPNVNDKMMENDMDEENSKDGNNILNWAFIGLGVIVIILLLIVILKVTKSIKQEKIKERNNMTYENLSNEASPPFPKNATLEDTYLSPVDCQIPPYMYLRSPDHETYAVPYVQPTNGAEDLYTKPIPKSQRKKDANIPLYSSVLPKSQRKKERIVEEITYAEIYSTSTDKKLFRDTEPQYACISNKILPESSNQDNLYANDFTDQIYMNTKTSNRSDDYAEPSYCEENKL